MSCRSWFGRSALGFAILTASTALSTEGRADATKTTGDASSIVSNAKKPPSDIDRLRREAKQARRKHDDARLLELLQEIDASRPSGTDRLEIAKLLVKQGRVAAAREVLRSIAELEGPGHERRADHKARVEAKKRAVALAPQVGQVTIVVPSKERATAVYLDGRELPRERWGKPLELDPGPHAVSALAGDKLTKKDFEVGPGAAREVTLDLDRGAIDLRRGDAGGLAGAAGRGEAGAGSGGAKTGARESSRDTVAGARSKKKARGPESTVTPLVPVALTAGGAGLVVGALTGSLALAKGAPTNASDRAFKDALETSAGISLGIGAAGAIVGGVAWIIDAEQHRGAPGPRKETTVWSPPGAAFGAGVSTSF